MLKFAIGADLPNARLPQAFERASCIPCAAFVAIKCIGFTLDRLDEMGFMDAIGIIPFVLVAVHPPAINPLVEGTNISTHDLQRMRAGSFGSLFVGPEDFQDFSFPGTLLGIGA